MNITKNPKPAGKPDYLRSLTYLPEKMAVAAPMGRHTSAAKPSSQLWFSMSARVGGWSTYAGVKWATDRASSSWGVGWGQDTLSWVVTFS